MGSANSGDFAVLGERSLLGALVGARGGETDLSLLPTLAAGFVALGDKTIGDVLAVWRFLAPLKPARGELLGESSIFDIPTVGTALVGSGGDFIAATWPRMSGATIFGVVAASRDPRASDVNEPGVCIPFNVIEPRDEVVADL